MLVKEGISFYNNLTPVKKRALPLFPLGFSDFSKKFAAAGLQLDGKVYLAVWNLGEIQKVTVPFDSDIVEASIGYPKEKPIEFSVVNNVLTVKFTETFQARFFEIKLNSRGKS